MQRLTRAAALGLLAFLGCGPPARGGGEVVAPPRIEVSGSAGTTKLLCAGDAEAERCFAELASDGDSCNREDDAGGCVSPCRRGDTGACHLVGRRFAADGNARCSAKVFELACEVGGNPSCLARAEQLATGADPKSLPARFSQLLTRACHADYAPACTRLGEHWFAGNDRSKSQGDGLALLEKACDKGDALGCRDAADAYDNRGNSEFADRDKALSYRQRACDLGHQSSCVDLARELLFGVVGRDEERGRELAERVCSLETDDDGGEACVLLARFLGINKAASADRIELLYRRGCDKGHFDACLWVIGDDFDEQRYADAIELASTLIERNAGHWRPAFIRGMSLFNQGKFGESIPDFERLCRLRSDWLHCELWLYAARERAAGKGKGEAGLRQDTRDTDLAAWPGPVVHYYLGKLGERALLDKAKNPSTQLEKEQLCEAYYYIGQQLMIDGKTQRASEMFKKSIATEVSNFIEYSGSKAELARMNPARSTP